MEELKPCPFCGGKPSVIRGDKISEGFRLNKKEMFKIYCRQCQIRQVLQKTKKGAIKLWNTRHAIEEIERKKDD